MDRNPPINSGDTSSTPGPLRFHMPRSKNSHVPQLLSLTSRACELQLKSPHAAATKAHVPGLCSAVREATMMRSPRTTTESSVHSPQLEKVGAQQGRPSTVTINQPLKKKKVTSAKSRTFQLFETIIVTVCLS